MPTSEDRTDAVIAEAKKLLGDLQDTNWGVEISDHLYGYYTVNGASQNVGMGTGEFIAAAPRLVRDLLAALASQREAVQNAAAARDVWVKAWTEKEAECSRLRAEYDALEKREQDLRALLKSYGMSDDSRCIDYIKSMAYRLRRELGEGGSTLAHGAQWAQPSTGGDGEAPTDGGNPCDRESR